MSYLCHIARHKIAAVEMLPAVRDDHGRLLLRVHSSEPLVHNFCRKWSIVCPFQFSLHYFVGKLIDILPTGC